MKHLIAPSILAADFTKLQAEFDLVNRSEADWFHLDVMDGRFVPNITFGMFIIEAMKKMAEKPLDVHLMIVEPEKYVEEFQRAGADVITVHYEACPHLHRTVQQIKATGAKAGVALNPHTSVSVLEDLLEDIDLVCLMSVNPGFGGQSFIPGTLPKIRQVRRRMDELGSAARLEVDGGIKTDNVRAVAGAGADTFVAGSAIFGSGDYAATIRAMRNEIAAAAAG